MNRFPRLAVLLLLLLAAPSAGATSQEAGLPMAEVFRPRDYDASTHNYSAVQDAHGVLHVANENLVLAYDGHRWRSTPTGGAFRTLLARDTHGRIWLGGADALGYLDENEFGHHAFTSLWDRLPATDRDYRGTSGLHVIDGVPVFSAWDRMLRWQGAEFAVERGLELPYQPGSARPFARTAAGVWREFDGKTWRVLADTPALRSEELKAVLPRADGSTLLVTLRQGLWLARDGNAAPFPTEVDATLRGRTVALAAELRDGTLAVALYPSGFLLLDPAGKLLHVVDADPDGQAAPLVAAFFEDRDGGLWVLRRTGIARVEWPAPLTYFNRARGLDSSTVRVTRRHRDRLYVGKSGGLFVSTPSVPSAVPAAPMRFGLVPGGSDSVWDLLPLGDELLVASVRGVGVLQADGTFARLLPNENVHSLLQPRASADAVLAGTERGLFLLRRGAGGWTVAGAVAGVDASINRLIAEPDGDVWISTLNSGFFRLPNFDPARPAVPEHYGGGHGFPDASLRGDVLVARLGARAALLHGHTVYRFDATARRFEKWFSAADRFGTDAIRLARLAPGLDGACWAQTMRHDDAAGPWGGRQLWRIDADGSWRQLPFAAQLTAGANPVFTEEKTADGHVLWLGGTEALVRAELPAAFVAPRIFRARVGEAQADGKRPLALAAAQRAALAPHEHTLRVGFGTDRIDDAAMRFQVRLEGRDDDWQPFESAATATMTGLAPGRYTLHARARDADGRVSEPASFAFTVLPPWWRTWWAWAGYAAAALGGAAGLVRWRLAAVRRRNAELEAIVATRTEEWRAAKLAAEAANHAKSAFLANMSHELRTPLNAMLGFAQILRRAPDLSPEHRQRLAVIGRNGDHLLQLINEVLDLAKIEAGKLALAPRPVALPPLLHGLAETYAARAHDKGLRFEPRFAPDLPAQVETDDAKLRQVLHNLLGNAVKFTAAGEIVFAVERVPAPGDPLVRFSVSDTGIGIEEAAQPHVFQAFFQAADRRLAAQGTGLGLAISQRIVGLMGGRIEVASRPGEGARFRFDVALPVSAAAAPPPPPRPIVGYAGPRRRLLVVDDETANRDVLRGMLEPLGFALDEAADGAAAIACFQAEPFDGVLLDLRMGAGPDGYAVARAMRAHAGGRKVAIVAVSASVFEEDRQTALDAGCDAFVPKPFTEERLCAVLAERLALAWTFVGGVETPPSAAVAAPAPATPALPAADLAELLALAHRGDVDALRERLAAVGSAHPGAAATVRHLDQLAANFQLGALRSALRAADAGRPAPRAP